MLHGSLAVKGATDVPETFIHSFAQATKDSFKTWRACPYKMSITHSLKEGANKWRYLENQIR